MWSLLHRNQDSLLVGAAVSLALLALLIHARPLPRTPEQAVAKTASVAGLHDVSRDPAYFAVRWREIATEFYDTHPVSPTQPSIPVVKAPVHERQLAAEKSPSPVIPASHRRPSVFAATQLQTASRHSLESQIRLKPTLVGVPAIAASLAAGFLAFLLFRMVWPTTSTIAENTVTVSDALRIEIPSDWVRVRGSLRQRTRPLVLTTSYIAAAIASWSICV